MHRNFKVFLILILSIIIMDISKIYSFAMVNKIKGIYIYTPESFESIDIPSEPAVMIEDSRLKQEVNKNIDNGKGIIYLTFDDGPDYYVTDKILDVLKEYNVKATFFVIGNQIEHKEAILKRINDEGHSIGLHSYSHKYKYIYQSEKNFIDEIAYTAKEVKNVTGVDSKIIRFPGGSTKHLNNEFLNNLHSLGYKIFDWNSSCGDGMYPNLSSEELYNNVLETSKHWKRVILLMHSSGRNKSTIDLLPLVIKHFQNKGYIFKTINEDTKECYFPF